MEQCIRIRRENCVRGALPSTAGHKDELRRLPVDIEGLYFGNLAPSSSAVARLRAQASRRHGR